MPTASGRKILVLTPVRNERQLLEKMLPAWRLFADHVIAADQGSDDGTREFLASRSDVTVVDNPDKEYNEINRSRLLIENAREAAPGAVFLYLDADETLSANALECEEWKRFCAEEPGTLGRLVWTNLWKSPRQYVARGQGSGFRMPLAFIDDGRPFKPHKVMHACRGVGYEDPKKVFEFQEVVALHFAWTFYETSVMRNNWYRAWWLRQGAKSYYVNNRNHGWFRSVSEADLGASLPEWTAGYTARGIDFSVPPPDEPQWRAIQILRWMKEDPRSFDLLDVWQDCDWEAMRKTAIARGVPGMPDAPIRRPGPAALFYGRWSSRQKSGRSLPGKACQFLFKRILP